MAVRTGIAASAISDLNEAVREKKRKLAVIHSFIRLRGIPPFVGQRVIDFYSYMTTRMGYSCVASDRRTS